MSTGPVRVAHVISHPIQYFAPLYRALTKRPEIDLTVYFYSDATATEFFDPGFNRRISWQTPLLDGYKWKVCPSAAGAPLATGFLRPPNWDIIREVALGHYDVVWAHSYSNLSTWLLLPAARARGARTLIREEQTLLRSRPWYKRALKQVALRSLFSLSGGLYIGEQNRRYFRHYGMSESDLFPARYCVDNDFFRGRAIELARDRKQVRASLGISDEAPVILFCGKLIERKQPLTLLETFESIRSRQPCWLLFAGDGPLRSSVDDLVARRSIPNVGVTGFLTEPETAAAYCAGDVLVLPSTYEPWGLVVNEAMNFGLPVVVLDRVGCAEDLVRDGWNGFVVSDRAELERALSSLVADPALRKTFGVRGRELVESYSIEACADGVVEACLASAGRKVRSRAMSPERFLGDAPLSPGRLVTASSEARGESSIAEDEMRC